MSSQPPSIHNLLKKIHGLEKRKTRYLSLCDFSKYKRVCELQEKIILQMKGDYYQKIPEKQRKSQNQKLAQDIQRQMETNHVLFEEIRFISQSYLEPLNSRYYDQGGNIKKTSKVFSKNI